MSTQIVVLGSGYAGTGSVLSLEEHLDGDAQITWVSDVDHHLVLHEAHRCIRDPSLRQKITFPAADIAGRQTEFLQARVEAVDQESQAVELESGEMLEYDYLVVGIGSQTAFFGIDGLEEHALTLKSLEDALSIHEAVKQAARQASRSAPARIVVGGAGLSGIQTAGEIAKFGEDNRAPLDITLVEGLDEIFPNNDGVVQRKLRRLLEDEDITIETGEFISAVDAESVYIGDDRELGYDVLIWTGGITGQEAAREVAVDQDDRSHRLEAASTFQTSDEAIFALGDAALIDQQGESRAPPTAQAAWQAAEVIGENIDRSIRGEPLKTWVHDDKGTLVSVGDRAVAHGVVGIKSVVNTFGGVPAEMLKKTVAARWINQVAGPAAAARAFPDM